jgi:hypothetical protein
VHDTYDYEPDHEASNIDTNVFKLMISNAHDQRPKRLRTGLDFSVWNTMSTEDRERWSSFSNVIKGNILNASSSDKPAARKFGGRPRGKFPPRRNPTNNNRTRNANLHEISAYDYLQEATSQKGHDIDDDHGRDKDEDVFVNSSSSDVPEDTNPLLAYVTKRSPTPGKAAVNSSPFFPPQRNGMRHLRAKLLSMEKLIER